MAEIAVRNLSFIHNAEQSYQPGDPVSLVSIVLLDFACRRVRKNICSRRRIISIALKHIFFPTVR